MIPSHIVFCAAVPFEVKSLCQQLQIPIPTPQDPVTFGRYAPFNITVLTSGIGINRMMQRLQQVQPMTHSCWISYGFAGALTDQLKTSECCIGKKVQYYRHQEITGDAPLSINCDDQSTLFCSEEIASTPEQKTQYHRSTGAHLVDMESYAVAVTAAQRNEPFFWLRGISDSAKDRLPVELLDCLDDKGYPSTVLSAFKILRKITLLPSAIRLGNVSFKTQKAMADRALQILENLSET